MDISEVLNLASIAHTVDSRSRHRSVSSTTTSLAAHYVIGDETGDALSKALALDECPLLFVSATGRVLVLRSGISGSVALEAVDTPTDAQTAVLALIGKAVWETAKVNAPEFYERPVSSRKKPKPVVAEVTTEEEIAADPVLDEVDASEPTE
jgi:hypothetical protein